jgi:hypothetical protein
MLWFAEYPARPGYLQIVSGDLYVPPCVEFDHVDVVSLGDAAVGDAAAEAWTPDGRVQLISTRRLPRETRLALKNERVRQSRLCSSW